MKIAKGHFTLSPDQKKFKELVSLYPQIALFWDFHKRECKHTALDVALPTLPHNERTMAGFFKALWDTQYKEGFDFYEAARTLEQEDRDVISRWLASPFFP